MTRRHTTLSEQAGRAARIPHADRLAEGRAARKVIPRREHDAFVAPASRPDPIAVLQAQDGDRLPDLVPIRYGRMAASTFSYFRGAAAVMAGDLAPRPVTGWLAQAAGDAHLENFGAFGTDVGDVVFDLNDFDETLPAPWEWDLHRLVASAAVALRELGAPRTVQRDTARVAAYTYRTSMDRLAAMGILERWTVEVRLGDALRALRARRRDRRRALAEALRHSNYGDLPRLTELHDGERILREHPPIVMRLRESEEHGWVDEVFDRYHESLRPELVVLLDRFSLVDVARKVVGVGSVGLPAYVGLFMSADGDPLFLQLKRAVQSVLAPHVASGDPFTDHAERVVIGQRLMQTTGDPLLGWTSDGTGRHFYVRQLHDLKYSFDLAALTLRQVERYVTLCARVLARAHSRTGDPALLAGYLGAGDKGGGFDTAIGEFAVTYADQAERDHAALVAAIADGRIEARLQI